MAVSTVSGLFFIFSHYCLLFFYYSRGEPYLTRTIAGSKINLNNRKKMRGFLFYKEEEVLMAKKYEDFFPVGSGRAGDLSLVYLPGGEAVSGDRSACSRDV